MASEFLTAYTQKQITRLFVVFMCILSLSLDPLYTSFAFVSDPLKISHLPTLLLETVCYWQTLGETTLHNGIMDYSRILPTFLLHAELKLLEDIHNNNNLLFQEFWDPHSVPLGVVWLPSGEFLIYVCEIMISRPHVTNLATVGIRKLTSDKKDWT